MKFGKIDHLILFGGSRILAEFTAQLKAKGNYGVDVYTSPRQIEDVIYPDGSTLRKALSDNDISFRVVEDINAESGVHDLITGSTLGLGMGEAWSFGKDLIKYFRGRLLDLMGIRLPQYRGGAHYSWQILRKNRIGCCNLQVINEEMVQGVYDSGELVKSREYLFPAGVRIPNDYFEAAVPEEIRFILEFLDEVKKGKDFPLTKVQEMFSLYFPRLNTNEHGFIDWTWDTEEIERFVCAFDDPYAGASTFLGEEKVRIKKVHSEFNDGPFHPFQTGMVYKISGEAVFVATKSGTLVIQEVIGEKGYRIEGLRPGLRFCTPQAILEQAASYHADYLPLGLKQR